MYIWFPMSFAVPWWRKADVLCLQKQKACQMRVGREGRAGRLTASTRRKLITTQLEDQTNHTVRTLGQKIARKEHEGGE
jgi:hypothetical protein